jgi:hypothetical protein
MFAKYRIWDSVDSVAFRSLAFAEIGKCRMSPDLNLSLFSQYLITQTAIGSCSFRNRKQDEALLQFQAWKPVCSHTVLRVGILLHATS